MQNKYKELIDTEAILCMRFILEKNSWSVLPIRKCVIRHIDIMPDNHYIYFSMGSLYDFTNVQDLSSVCVDISQSERETIGNTLFFRTNLGILIPECKNDSQEDASWVSFTNLIAKDTTLPLRDEAKKSLFIRFQGISRDKPTERGVMYKSWSSGEVCGTILTEGLSYELVFYHRVPSLIDQNISLKKFLLKYKSPSGNFELNKTEEEVTGNYQKHILNISALKPSGTSEELTIELPEQVESQDGRKINTINSRIPLKIKFSPLYRLKHTWGWVFIVWASLFTNVIIDNLSQEKINWSLTIISAVIALLSAIGVFMLQQRGSNK
jgi:hypothetical protein